MVTGLPAEARRALLDWYDARGRTLAFRATRDPYAILVSEVMAQQTQISRVVPAWQAFLRRFPTVGALADASPADVLRAWQGMGYDRRALNLRRAAQAIVAEHGGRVPNDIEALEALPGIGPYTARAVASIAFGQRVGAVDTNVRRVLGRALGLETRAATPASRGFQVVADASVDPDRPADWTHAVMDLGATVCKPRTPLCDACPLAAWCRFAALGSRESTMPGRRGRVTAATAVTSPRPAFTATTRWLRGRILDRLRAAVDPAWTRLDEPIGVHDVSAVAETLVALAAEGLIELDPADARQARLAAS
jgi:A/G-specific adenine glycosylase